MQKKKTALIVLILVVATGILTYFIFFDKERTNWEQHYREESNDPYGTSVLYGLLKERSTSIKDITSDYLLFIKKHASKDTNSNIVLVNKYSFVSDTESVALMNWASKGNIIFLATQSIPNELINKLYSNKCNQEWGEMATVYDSIVYPNFSLLSQRDSNDYVYKSPYRPKSIINNEPIQWTVLNSKYLCPEEDSIVQYGYLSASVDSGYVNLQQLLFERLFTSEVHLKSISAFK
jgi:hypothetical protein